MKPARKPDPQRELARLEALCARSEQCTADIRSSMLRRGFTAAQADEIITSLTDRRFIDDERFATAFVRDKYRFSGWGTIKITAALYARRLPRPLIDRALRAIDTAEYAAIAFRAIASRLRRLPDDMPRHIRRQKLMQFGASRGYESQLIIRILDSSRLWDSDKA